MYCKSWYLNLYDKFCEQAPSYPSLRAMTKSRQFFSCKSVTKLRVSMPVSIKCQRHFVAACMVKQGAYKIGLQKTG